MNAAIEFEVELNAVPARLDLQGKDVTVNWRMYDGFEANKTFWTDSTIQDDERGLNEALEELDDNGYGLKINAKY